MKWKEIQRQYPHQWIVTEALQSHSAEGKRILDQLSVIQISQDGQEAMQQCFLLQRREPQREFYFFHTDRKELDIEEEHWIGIRGGLLEN